MPSDVRFLDRRTNGGAAGAPSGRMLPNTISLGQGRAPTAEGPRPLPRAMLSEPLQTSCHGAQAPSDAAGRAAVQRGGKVGTEHVGARRGPGEGRLHPGHPPRDLSGQAVPAPSEVYPVATSAQILVPGPILWIP